MLKIVGRAVATQRAYYPLESGHCRIIEPGETFDLVEGHTVGEWFVRADPIAAPEPEAAPAPRRRKAAAPEPEAQAEPDPLA